MANNIYIASIDTNVGIYVRAYCIRPACQVSKKDKRKMKYNPLTHNRRSIRLKGYDYSRAGAYFITICTNERLPLFGEIINGEMILSEMG